jgi:hypothetical protein
MSRIFISHAVDDKALVKSFVDLLQTGMQVRYTDIYCTSKGDIDGGSQYIDDMKEHLRNCDVVVMLLSVNYFKSPFCLAEMGGAWALNKPLAPFLIPPKQFMHVEQPSTPLKTTQIFKIQDKQNITQFFQKLLSLKIVEQFDLHRMNEKVDEFIKGHPWTRTSPLNSRLGGRLSGEISSLRPPVIGGSLDNLPRNNLQPQLQRTPLSAQSLQQKKFGNPPLRKE